MKYFTVRNGELMINIAFEGIDNAGKTTLAIALHKHLEDNGHKVHVSKELTTNVGELVTKAFATNENISPELKTYLFAADRLIRYEKIVKENFDYIIWDRYTFSALAYRTMEGVDTDWVNNINSIFPSIDFYYYIDIDPELSRSRNNKHCPYSINQLAKCREIYKTFVEAGKLKQLETQKISNMVDIIFDDLMENKNGKN